MLRLWALRLLLLYGGLLFIDLEAQPIPRLLPVQFEHSHVAAFVGVVARPFTDVFKHLQNIRCRVHLVIVQLLNIDVWKVVHRVRNVVPTQTDDKMQVCQFKLDTL